MLRSKVAVLLTLIAMLIGIGGTAHAYPDEAIQIIVNRSPGGSIDTSARVLADFVSQELGVSVVAVNQPGASGRVGLNAVFRSNADGYTLGTLNAPGAQIGDVLYDPPYRAEDFTYVYGYARSGHVLAVRENASIDDVDDLLDRVNSERITVGTFGRGSSGHLQAVVYLDTIGVLDKVNFVHFAGSAPLGTALLGGHVDVGVFGYGFFNRTDGLRGLIDFAQDGSQVGKLADVPTPSELGHDAMPILEQIFGLLAPPDLPDDVVRELKAVLDEATRDPSVQESFSRLNLDLVHIGPAEFGELATQYVGLAQQYQHLIQ